MRRRVRDTRDEVVGSDDSFPSAPPVHLSELTRTQGVSWSVPLTGLNRWFIAGEVVVAAIWLWAYSYPVPALLGQLLGVVGLVFLAIPGVVVTGNNRRSKGHEVSLLRPGRAVGAVAAIFVVTTGLCATSSPMWVRFLGARSAMTHLAVQARPIDPNVAPASAGTYHFDNVYRDPNGLVFFGVRKVAGGILSEGAFLWSPSKDPRALNSDDAPLGGPVGDVTEFRHLQGPWWVVTSSGPFF